MAAAAKRWNVDHASCVQSGEVLHTTTGRTLKYGEVAADAARIPVPKSVALKQPKDFTLIGTPAKRLDAPSKVNGTAVYGIDVRPPGAKIASAIAGLRRPIEERGRCRGRSDQDRKGVGSAAQTGAYTGCEPMLLTRSCHSTMCERIARSRIATQLGAGRLPTVCRADGRQIFLQTPPPHRRF